MMSDNPGTSPVTPLLLDARAASAMLGMSRTSFFGLLSAGRIPAPVFRAGRIVRWSSAEIKAWCAAGCPSGDRWRVMRSGTG